MIKKFLNYLIKDIKMNYKFYLILIFITLLFVIKLDYYIYSPGSLIDLTDRIKVENAYKSEGSFNLTYVTARNGNLFNLGLSFIIPSWDRASVDDMRVEDENTEEITERDKIYLKETSYDAIIAAFSEANLEYTINKVDVTVTYVYKNANTDLKSGDIIKSIDGVSVSSYEEVRNEIEKHNENDKLIIKVIRNEKEKECYAILQKQNDKIMIGVNLSELKDVSTNPNVSYIFKDNESGSSRGLMCALDIYNKITSFDLTKGKKVAGTGSIDEKGNVGKIDGVKYKLKGAVKNKAEVFIVPSKNYEEAIKLKEENGYDIIIIEADNLHNVIEKLNNL